MQLQFNTMSANNHLTRPIQQYLLYLKTKRNMHEEAKKYVIHVDLCKTIFHTVIMLKEFAEKLFKQINDQLYVMVFYQFTS